MLLPGEVWVPDMLLILFMMPVVLLFTLFPLFAEPRIGKARARKCRYGYSLLVDAAAVVAGIA